MENQNFDSYDFLAQIYDDYQGFKDNKVDLEWSRFLQRMTADLNSREKTAIDLGCGTGRIAWEMSRKGWEVIAVDNSEEMLSAAWTQEDSRFKNTNRPNFVLQDILELDLGLEADLIYTSLDVFNHFNKNDLDKVLESVIRHMHTGSKLIFDLHSKNYLTRTLANNNFSRVEEDYALIWQNSYDELDEVNSANISLFTYLDDEDLYERVDFEIVEYFHEVSDVLVKLQNLGLNVREINAEEDEFPSFWGDKRHFILAEKVEEK